MLAGSEETKTKAPLDGDGFVGQSPFITKNFQSGL
jgi:hypothetical protein